MKFKEEIQNVIDDWWLGKQGLSKGKNYLDKVIMKAVNKRVKSINIGEIFKDFIWSDDKKDISDLIIHIKKSIIKEMK